MNIHESMNIQQVSNEGPWINGMAPQGSSHSDTLTSATCRVRAPNGSHLPWVTHHTQKSLAQKSRQRSQGRSGRLTVHVPFVLILNERISPGLSSPTISDHENLHKRKMENSDSASLIKGEIWRSWMDQNEFMRFLPSHLVCQNIQSLYDSKLFMTRCLNQGTLWFRHNANRRAHGSTTLFTRRQG